MSGKISFDALGHEMPSQVVKVAVSHGDKKFEDQIEHCKNIKLPMLAGKKRSFQEAFPEVTNQIGNLAKKPRLHGIPPLMILSPDTLPASLLELRGSTKEIYDDNLINRIIKHKSRDSAIVILKTANEFVVDASRCQDSKGDIKQGVNEMLDDLDEWLHDYAPRNEKDLKEIISLWSNDYLLERNLSE